MQITWNKIPLEEMTEAQLRECVIELVQYLRSDELAMLLLRKKLDVKSPSGYDRTATGGNP